MLGPAVVSLPIWLMFAIPASYAAALILGVPAFLLFRKAGWLSRGGIMLGASAIGLIVGLAVALIFASSESESMEFFLVVIVFVAFGAFTGHSYWWLVNRAADNDA